MYFEKGKRRAGGGKKEKGRSFIAESGVFTIDFINQLIIVKALSYAHAHRYTDIWKTYPVDT